jgi:hypothetical protein
LCFLIHCSRLQQELEIVHIYFPRYLCLTIASPDICRTRRSPSNKIAKGLSPEELAGESVGDSGGSAAAAAVAGDMLVRLSLAFILTFDFCCVCHSWSLVGPIVICGMNSLLYPKNCTLNSTLSSSDVFPIVR